MASFDDLAFISHAVRTTQRCACPVHLHPHTLNLFFSLSLLLLQQQQRATTTASASAILFCRDCNEVAQLTTDGERIATET